MRPNQSKTKMSIIYFGGVRKACWREILSWLFSTIQQVLGQTAILATRGQKVWRKIHQFWSKQRWSCTMGPGATMYLTKHLSNTFWHQEHQSKIGMRVDPARVNIKALTKLCNEKQIIWEIASPATHQMNSKVERRQTALIYKALAAMHAANLKESTRCRM